MNASARDLVYRDLDALLSLYEHLHSSDAPLPARPQLDAMWQTLCDSRDHLYFGVDVDGLLAASCTVTIVPNLTRGVRPYGTTRWTCEAVSRTSLVPHSFSAAAAIRSAHWRTFGRWSLPSRSSLFPGSCSATNVTTCRKITPRSTSRRSSDGSRPTRIWHSKLASRT